MPRSANPPRLELRQVSKRFGATRALEAVSIAFGAGEVHVIAGENGAGKSTLIRVLSGAHREFEGELWLDGRRARFANPAAARAAGIATIHQELSLVPSLSIADNVLLAERASLFSAVGRTHARAAAERALAAVDLHIDVDTSVEDLPLSARQLLEIGRCLCDEARVFIFDEPTSALSDHETARLFESIERVRGSGAAILYISHRMDEIYRLADRISVLRDGRLVLTAVAADLTQSALVRAMLGHDVDTRAADRAVGARAESVLRVQGFASDAPPRFLPFDLEVRAGETLGVCGLRDSGASSVLACLGGARPARAASVHFAGAASALPRSERAAWRLGIALLPADRRASVFDQLSIVENATLSSLRRHCRYEWIDGRRERAAVHGRLASVALEGIPLAARAATLSGGTQQKLALLRCLMAEPRLLLLDDPTRGVDIAAKADVYALIQRVVGQSKAVVVQSSELDELVSLCDRVIVFFRGAITATLTRAELTRERLLTTMMGRAP